MNIVFIGLTISSSWGNGHATTYRGLLRELGAMGHEVTFFEHDKPWYRNNRDFDQSEHYQLVFYNSRNELEEKYYDQIQSAHFVIVGSYVPEGVDVSRWVLQTAEGITAFYDIDTPITLQNLDEGKNEYIDRSLVKDFDLYLSFSGGEVLTLLEKSYGAKTAKPLYCSVDPTLYYPMDLQKKWEVGYLGTYSHDRQPTVENFLIRTAERMEEKKFVVAGPGYPREISWPQNVELIEHLSPHLHREFYNLQKFTLNVTRQAMIKLGYSPSVRLFEAAACGIPIISDDWEGLQGFFLEGKEIFIARSQEDMMSILKNTSESDRKKVADAALQKVMNLHTSARRALELISYYQEVKQYGKRKSM
jgi:spore maturation protein CgeB